MHEATNHVNSYSYLLGLFIKHLLPTSVLNKPGCQLTFPKQDHSHKINVKQSC